MEIIKRIFVLHFIVFSFIACSNTAQPKKQNTNEKVETYEKKDFISNDTELDNLAIKNINGILVIFENNSKYTLSSKGIDNNPHLSRNKDNLVVDILLPNNLNTVNIFYKDYKFKKAIHHLKKKVLEEFLLKNKYQLENISFFEMKFFDWVDNDTFELIISGEYKNKRFEEKIRYDFPKK